MGLFEIFRHLYVYLEKRRTALFIGTGLVILLSFIYLGKIRLSEDIRSLLPDSNSDFLLEFNLLQKTPFMHKVIINLKESSSPGNSMRLMDIADEFKKGILSSSFITGVTSGPLENQELDIIGFIIKSLPNLITPDDLDGIRADLNERHIHDLLTEKYSALFSPEGSMLAEDIRIDPVNLKTVVLKKLASLNVIPEATMKNNHFIDRSGHNLLLVAETNVDVTDTAGARKLLDELNKIRQKTVPEDIKMYILSPQSYTVANALAIKKDLYVVLSISSLSLIILFFLFLKNWRACFILLISFSSFAIALSCVSLVYATVSAITIGFGSVLLGLSDDLSLHVYFALRNKLKKETSLIMSEVSRPVLFGGIIVICSLSLLLFSDLPGQRQLGLFSIAGVVTSLVFTLILLPQLMEASSQKSGVSGNIFLIKGSVKRPVSIILIWIILIALSIWSGRQIRFDGDLNSLNYKSPELIDTEKHLKETWGDLQGKVMIFSEGNDLDSALRANEKMYQYLLKGPGNGSITSIAPILPSTATQKANIAAWKKFWSVNKVKLKELLQKEGSSIGFTDDAFDPFLKSLETEPELITPVSVSKTGIKGLVDTFILPENHMVRVLTLVPDNDETKAMLKKNEFPPDNKFVSRRYIGEVIRNTVGRDFTHFITGAMAVIIILLIPLFKDTKKVLLSMVPVVSGMVFTFGIMGLSGISFNIFNVISSILIIGLGIDYGIFMVCRCSEEYEHDTDTAVLLSGLTTLTGFGALAFASHPALFSIGITVLLGIGAAIPAAIYVIPALYAVLQNREGNLK
jgi:uncharacterized protein